ncbi:MAG TPA: isoamylase [Roseiflexaceae bacterium]|nr:isoamylase [Roseiflexaceae bacterium]
MHEGAASPLGATWIEEHQAYNFALYSRHATGVTLLLYRADDPVTPVYQYRFNHRTNKTGRVWHCWVPADDLRGATLYAYRVEGPVHPQSGHHFDAQKILLDPYAPGVFFPPCYSRDACVRPGPTDGVAPLGILPAPRPPYEWEPIARPRHTADAVIYELHVRGFTMRANSGVTPEHRGTFAGLIEKIPYLQELGITIVELLPVQQYDPHEGNYWGYMTLNFFSPHMQYAYDDPIDEFRTMVSAFHAAGIEVWLDVVYNHTSEGSERGPTYSYRGIDNRSYYLMNRDLNEYINDSGTGNTLRCGHSAVRGLILDSLQFWSATMQVDGFRFDLASIFTRNSDGTINMNDPALIAEISQFAHNYDVRLVAEAWDIGSYQLGSGFPGLTWLQWNGKFRDDVRSFVRGDPGMVHELMRRLYGSDDLFPDTLHDAYRPYQSVNFITAHDGFCLYDLVSYNYKHNLANGQNNTDGSDDNRSWNCGWEGDVGAPLHVLALRRRQVRNICAILMLANGVPMLCAGDEFLNTQHGNNNPYNQDNETTWLNWDLLERNRDIFRFFRMMIAFRKAHPSIARGRFWRSDIRWYGVGALPDLSFHSHTIAYCLHGEAVDDDDLYVMINGYVRDLIFTIQEGHAGEWLRVVDTSLDSPDDIVEPGHEPLLDGLEYTVHSRSVVVLRRRRSF